MRLSVAAFLMQAGARLYDHMGRLNATGVLEVARRVPFFLSYIKKCAHYIAENNFDEVVLVDFPGFNLRLARRLKRLCPDLKITYCSPPQLWVWGAWRTRALKKYVDRLVVLYPFEVAWYEKRGIAAEWHGYPYFEQLRRFGALGVDAIAQRKGPMVAIVPASRPGELRVLMPIFAAVMKRLLLRYADISFVIPLAESFSREFMEEELKRNGFRPQSSSITIVSGEEGEV